MSMIASFNARIIAQDYGLWLDDGRNSRMACPVIVSMCVSVIT